MIRVDKQRARCIYVILLMFILWQKMVVQWTCKFTNINDQDAYVCKRCQVCLSTRACNIKACESTWLHNYTFSHEYRSLFKYLHLDHNGKLYIIKSLEILFWFYVFRVKQIAILCNTSSKTITMMYVIYGYCVYIKKQEKANAIPT